MAEDDVIEELHGVTTMGMTSVARVGETLLRASQDRAARQAHELREGAEDAQRRYEAQVRTAEQFYRRTAEPAFARQEVQDVVVTAWQGAQGWKELEPDRIGPYADRLNAAIREEYGVDLADIAERLGEPALAAELGEMRIQRTRGADEDEDLGDVDDADRVADAGVASGMEWDSAAARRARTEQLKDDPNVPAELRQAALVVEHQKGYDPALAAAAGGTAATKTRARGPGRGRSRGRGQDVGR